VDLTALPQTPSWFKGPASKREEEGREKGKGEEGNWRGRPPPLSQIPGSAMIIAAAAVVVD